MTEDEAEDLLDRFATRIETQAPAPTPPGAAWIKWVAGVFGLIAIVVAAGGFVYQTKAAANDHAREPAHREAEQRLGVLEKTQEGYGKLLRVLDHNVIKIGERIEAQDLVKGDN